jgi:hypothetical protein
LFSQNPDGKAKCIARSQTGAQKKPLWTAQIEHKTQPMQRSKDGTHKRKKPLQNKGPIMRPHCQSNAQKYASQNQNQNQIKKENLKVLCHLSMT